MHVAKLQIHCESLTAKRKSLEKELDAVRMMRTTRDKVAEQWATNPKEVEQKLEEIRRKFNIKVPEQAPVSVQIT